LNTDDRAAPKILTAPYYERLDDLERRHWWCRSVRRVALEMVEPFVAPGAVVLDAGCGAGGLLEEVTERWPEVRVVGADVSWDALKFARGRGLRGLIVGSAAELPVASESVDVVFSNDVLQHLDGEEDSRALLGTLRVLKRGGVVCVRVNLGHDGAGGASPSPTAPTEAQHRQYGRQQLAELLTRAGFRVERHLVLHPLAGAMSKGRQRKAQNHESGGGLSTRVPPAPVNSLMDLYVRVEDFVVSRLPWTLAAGDTQVLLARKSDKRGSS